MLIWLQSHDGIAEMDIDFQIECSAAGPEHIAQNRKQQLHVKVP